MNTAPRPRPEPARRTAWHRLLPRWRELTDRQFIAGDLIAGTTVALTAVPLSMAIAIASDVPPAAGLVTAMVAGTIAALFGGAPLAISGPAAAMAVLVASIVEEHGISGLVLASLVAAALQLASGLLGLGRIARLVPLPVVLGFSAGIGVVIIVGQLPRALGLPAPDQAHVVDVITHIGELIEHASPAAAAIAGVTLAIMLGSARLSPRIPGPLLAVAATTIAATVIGLDVAQVGEIPRAPFAFPTIALADIDLWALAGDALVIFALASLETLLSASAVDRMSRGAPHDPDQELVGQGLANLAAVGAGGLIGTAVIARSGLNFAAGGRTRRSAIIHAFGVAVIVLVLSPLVATIPMPALAGILLAIGIGMIAPREFIALWRLSRSEAAVYLVTFTAMVAFDLVAGVRVGVGISLAIAAIRFGRSDTRVTSLGDRGPYRLAFRGPLTFLSMHRVDELRARVPLLDPTRGAIVDLADVPDIDVSGGDALGGLLADLEAHACPFAIVRDTPLPDALATHDADGLWATRVVATESDAMRLLGATDDFTPNERLVDGVERFRAARERHMPLFQRLAIGQSPHTLFVACSDSRISPLLITSTEPGEVFVHRNIGNIVPPMGTDDTPAEGAGVEYAIGVLGVKQIVICGHSSCGAMAAIANGVPPGLPSVERWLHFASHVRQRVPVGASPDALARANVLVQLENLRTYDIVRRAMDRGELTIHGWYYDIGEAEIETWDAERGAFVPVRGTVVGGPSAADDFRRARSGS